VGLSLGGEVAYVLLAHHPELLSRAVIDGAAIVPSRLAPLFKTAVGVVSPFLHRGAVIRTMGNALGVPVGDLPRFEEGMRSVAPSTFRRAFNQAQDPGVLAEVLACRVPTLLVTGESELADMHAANAALAAHMPHAEARVVPGVGHGWVASHPDLHARIVDAWMSGALLPEELRPERPTLAESRTARRVAAATGTTPLRSNQAAAQRKLGAP
jgi:3-oxoadipate enol-lactonase